MTQKKWKQFIINNMKKLSEMKGCDKYDDFRVWLNDKNGQIWNKEKGNFSNPK